MRPVGEECILSGAWQRGDRIPSEHELAERYGCSRMTVNKALTQLTRAGYVERRRPAGTFVRQPQAQAAVLEVHTVAREVAAPGLPYGYELLERSIRQPNLVERDRLERGGDASLLAVTCLHHAGGQPFCHEERVISLDVAPEAASADLATESPGAWLLGTVTWREAEHLIGAERASGAVSRHLDIAEGAACLTVERRIWDAKRVVTWVRLSYPPTGNASSPVSRRRTNASLADSGLRTDSLCMTDDVAQRRLRLPRLVWHPQVVSFVGIRRIVARVFRTWSREHTLPLVRR
jgi:GntR family histidine utilization transcriptional repressor